VTDLRQSVSPRRASGEINPLTHHLVRDTRKVLLQGRCLAATRALRELGILPLPVLHEGAFFGSDGGITKLLLVLLEGGITIASAGALHRDVLCSVSFLNDISTLCRRRVWVIGATFSLRFLYASVRQRKTTP